MREKTNAHDTLPDSTVDLVLDPAARQALLDWYGREHRRLPWRAEPGGLAPAPYAVLVSELMLQQTRVDPTELSTAVIKAAQPLLLRAQIPGNEFRAMFS